MIFTSVQSLSHVRFFATPWTAGFPVHHQLRSLLKLMSIESVMPSNHLILCRPLLLPPSIFPSIRVFSNQPVICIRWQNYWSFTVATREESGVICFPSRRGLTPRVSLDVHRVSDAIQPSHPVFPFSSCPQSLPASAFICFPGLI